MGKRVPFTLYVICDTDNFPSKKIDLPATFISRKLHFLLTKTPSNCNSWSSRCAKKSQENNPTPKTLNSWWGKQIFWTRWKQIMKQEICLLFSQICYTNMALWIYPLIGKWRVPTSKLRQRKHLRLKCTSNHKQPSSTRQRIVWAEQLARWRHRYDVTVYVTFFSLEARNF